MIQAGAVMRSFGCALIGLAAVAGTAAAQASDPARPGAACRVAPASFALGQVYSDRLAGRARRRAGASVVRKVEPGRTYTMDFRPDRLNLDVDRRGRVRAVRCG